MVKGKESSLLRYREERGGRSYSTCLLHSFGRKKGEIRPSRILIRLSPVKKKGEGSDGGLWCRMRAHEPTRLRAEMCRRGGEKPGGRASGTDQHSHTPSRKGGKEATRLLLSHSTRGELNVALNSMGGKRASVWRAVNCIRDKRGGGGGARVFIPARRSEEGEKAQ